MRTKIAVFCIAVISMSIFGCGRKRIADNIDLPFVDDPAVAGEWTSVDYVPEPSRFIPGVKSYKDELYLKKLAFMPKGRMLFDRVSETPRITWTRGVVLNGIDKTAASYSIKDIGGVKYMFFEWKSGDYVFRHQAPKYYVLKRNM